jgi:hypothetical protein
MRGADGIYIDRMSSIGSKDDRFINFLRNSRVLAIQEGKINRIVGHVCYWWTGLRLWIRVGKIVFGWDTERSQFGLNPLQSRPDKNIGNGVEDKSIEPGIKAQVLATLIQSQDNVTWLAFSLAMTIQALLIIGFVSGEMNQSGRVLICFIGLMTSLIFWGLTTRSLGDMGIFYRRACQKSFSYETVFDLPAGERRSISAGMLMFAAFIGWIILWSILIGKVS